MSNYLLFNGEFHNASSLLISPSNSGFRFGEGLFETIRITDGKAALLSFHFERLLKGLQVLEWKVPMHFTLDYIEQQVQLLLSRHEYSRARVRLTVFSSAESLVEQQPGFNWVLQCYPLDKAYFQWNEQGYRVDIAEGIFKSNDALSNLKTNNYLPFVMASRQAAHKGLHDMLITKTAGNIIESSIANIFIVKDEKILTPPLPDGPVAGVMRRYLLKNLPSQGWEVKENSLQVNDLLNADELFLTNALFGIRWVASFRQKLYGKRISGLVYSTLINNM